MRSKKLIITIKKRIYSNEFIILYFIDVLRKRGVLISYLMFMNGVIIPVEVGIAIIFLIYVFFLF